MAARKLEQLADACGVLTSFEDAFKRRQTVSVESLLAVLNVLGVDVLSLDDVPQALEAQRLRRLERGVEPVVVAWEGAPVEFELTLPAMHANSAVDCTIEPEDRSAAISQRVELGPIRPEPSACGRFATRRVRLARCLSFGYHRLTIDGAGRSHEALIISAPRRAYSANVSAHKDWGCFLPLYALRSERNWGAGDLTDLHNLGDWIAKLGGNVVGTLPLLAAFLDEPCEPSPYSPASRLAWNEFYVDVTRIPEFRDCPEAVELVQSSAFQDDVSRLRDSELVDYRRIMALKRRVLQMLADAFFENTPQDRYARFEQFLKQHPHVDDYAEFRATCERRKEPWDRWPRALHDGRLSESDFDRRSKQYHLYAQWVATTQLDALADAAGGGLYLDLPLGVLPDGYDVWRWNEAYANEASAGSPPEPMWTSGQNWGFPPLHPERIREHGYRHVRDYLTHHLRLARILRIDHVMQLHRLYWIPRGLQRNQGAYVRYHPEEFYAILNIESHRCQTTLIGENLGTVPREVNQAMERHNVKPMYIMQYEVASPDDDPRGDGPDLAPDPSAVPEGTPAGDRTRNDSAPLRDVPPGALASLNTHDMPTFAAWWSGEEISLRQQLDLLTEEEARHEWDQLATKKVELTTWLRSAGWLKDGPAAEDSDILLAILKFLAASDAGAVMLNLEDLWQEARPQNIPGTGPELPNWKRKAAVAFDEFARQPHVLKALRAVAELRSQEEVSQSRFGVAGSDQREGPDR